jgi:hypothetical protein
MSDQLQLFAEPPQPRPWDEELTAWEAKMKAARYEAAVNEERFQQLKRVAESWAHDIRQAFLNRQPCPIITSDPVYESVLQWAFQLAAVPKDCLPTPIIDDNDR